MVTALAAGAGHSPLASWLIVLFVLGAVCAIVWALAGGGEG